MVIHYLVDHLDVDLISILRLHRRRNELVGADIRMRNQRQERCGSRVNRGDRSFGTKVADPLRVRRHSCNLGLSLPQSEPLVVEKEKSPVLDNRAAEGAPELVSPQLVLLIGDQVLSAE